MCWYTVNNDFLICCINKNATYYMTSEPFLFVIGGVSISLDRTRKDEFDLA